MKEAVALSIHRAGIFERPDVKHSHVVYTNHCLTRIRELGIFEDSLTERGKSGDNFVHSRLTCRISKKD